MAYYSHFAHTHRAVDAMTDESSEYTSDQDEYYASD